MNEVDVEVFIKFGEETHMNNLFEKGEVYMNPIDYFKYHTNPQIGDIYENLKYIWQIPKANLKLSANNIDEIIIPDTNGHILVNSDEKGNLYCLFSVKATEFIRNEDNNTLELDLKIYKDFGDCACIIYKPKTFFDLVEKKLNDEGHICNKKLVKYYDPYTHNGSLDIFWKRNKYSHQKEARVHVNYDMDKEIKFEIGSLEKVALFKPNLDDKIRIESTETHLIFSRLKVTNADKYVRREN